MKKYYLIGLGLILFPSLIFAQSHIFERDLYYGLTNDPDVKVLQEILDKEGCFDWPEYTGNFYSLTKKGVICFQEKYAKDILEPLGLTKGTGYVGPSTRAKLNELYGEVKEEKEKEVKEKEKEKETVIQEKPTISERQPFLTSQIIAGDLIVTGDIKTQRIYQEEGDLIFTTLRSGNIIFSAATGFHVGASQIIMDSTSLTNPLIYISDPLKIAGAITQTGSGQVSFSGNVDAQSGLDVTGGDLTVGGNKFTVDVDTGNISTAGNLNVSGDLIISGNETITGSLTVKATTTLGDASTDNIIFNAGAGSNLDMKNYLLVNIGATGTEFTSGGGLNLAGNLDVSGTTTTLATTTVTRLKIKTTYPEIYFEAPEDTARITWAPAGGPALETGLEIFGGNKDIVFTSPIVMKHAEGLKNVTGITTLATTTVDNIQIGGGDRITKHIAKSAPVSFNLDTPNTCTDATTSVSGAAAGDAVAVGVPDSIASLSELTWVAWVSVADVVTLRHCTGGVTTTDATADVKFHIWQP